MMEPGLARMLEERQVRKLGRMRVQAGLEFRLPRELVPARSFVELVEEPAARAPTAAHGTEPVAAAPAAGLLCAARRALPTARCALTHRAWCAAGRSSPAALPATSHRGRPVLTCAGGT